MMLDKFTLEFGLADFEKLNHKSKRSFYSRQAAAQTGDADRFNWANSKQFGKKYNDVIDLKSKLSEFDPKFPEAQYDLGWFMYWVGTNILNALISEKILQAAGYKVYLLYDWNENPEPEWCILCNYQSDSIKACDDKEPPKHTAADIKNDKEALEMALRLLVTAPDDKSKQVLGQLQSMAESFANKLPPQDVEAIKRKLEIEFQGAE